VFSQSDSWHPRSIIGDLLCGVSSEDLFPEAYGEQWEDWIKNPIHLAGRDS
jgi:hypothetical protein